MQKVLWRFVETGAIAFYTLLDADALRMRTLMDRYNDAPMDLADASLVTAAEALGLQQVFTLDRHFYAYRINNRQPFVVAP